MTEQTRVCIGVLAHVDAGKTTLCEQILYHAGAIRAAGRVDHGDTALDVNEIERARGITVFSDQSTFELNGCRYTLIDTPGHVDFAAETERALLALDFAILVVDGGAGVQAHASMLFHLAQQYQIPVLILVNKTDLVSYDPKRIRAQIRDRLSKNDIWITPEGEPDREAVAELDDAYCALYLDGRDSETAIWDALTRLFQARAAVPVLVGSALSGIGVETLMRTLSRLTRLPKPEGSERNAVAYKVRRDKNGDRVTFLRIRSGELQTRDTIRFGEETEKVHQIRRYRGAAYDLIDRAVPGDAVGVTGLTQPRCGDRISGDILLSEGARFQIRPVLSARAIAPEGISPTVLLQKFKILEDEEPLLSVSPSEDSVTVYVMGSVQLEVLEQTLWDRFGLRVSFLPPLVLYRETIAAPTIGCGHYEPLRHYAETHLLLEPTARGSGITFESRCHVDDLAESYQHLIRTHVLEKKHCGVLTGAPITDIRVTLLAGRAHLKHTEGGDFREATYRAIRQGLSAAQSVLLEPYYRFDIRLPAALIGRAMSDVLAMAGTFDAPETAGGEARLCGRGPVATFLDYPNVLRAYARGMGDIQLQADGYDVCHDADAVIRQADYNPDADSANSSGSVFCAHGAGFFVPWREAPSYMHLSPLDLPQFRDLAERFRAPSA